MNLKRETEILCYTNPVLFNSGIENRGTLVSKLKSFLYIILLVAVMPFYQNCSKAFVKHNTLSGAGTNGFYENYNSDSPEYFIDSISKQQGNSNAKDTIDGLLARFINIPPQIIIDALNHGDTYEGKLALGSSQSNSAIQIVDSNGLDVVCVVEAKSAGRLVDGSNKIDLGKLACVDITAL